MPASLTDPDQVPEPPIDPVSRVGDVWLLGRHRLLCGDSTSATDVQKVLGSVRPNLMVTAAYGVNYAPNWRSDRDLSRSKRAGKVENDERADGAMLGSCSP